MILYRTCTPPYGCMEAVPGVESQAESPRLGAGCYLRVDMYIDLDPGMSKR
jgi:hypothetical protein